MRNECMISDNTDKEIRTDNLSNRPNENTNSYNTITEGNGSNSKLMVNKDTSQDNPQRKGKKIEITKGIYKQPIPNKPKTTNSKLSYRKLINLLNKSLNTDKELSHSSIANSKVNTVRLSFMNNKDSVFNGVNYV